MNKRYIIIKDNLYLTNNLKGRFWTKNKQFAIVFEDTEQADSVANLEGGTVQEVLQWN